MRKVDILLSRNELDVELGLLIYSTPSVYVGNYVHDFIPYPLNFQVREIGFNNLPANTTLCNLESNHIECKKGEVLLYILCKEHLSTLEAINIAKKILGVHHIGYAGLKDTSASTCQYVTIKCRENREIPTKVSKHISEKKGLILCFVSKSPSILKRGHLLGNEFTIRLRVKNGYEDLVATTLRSKLSRTLFLNYFGYQRFGTLRPYNHVIGRLILESRYEEAVDYIVGKPTLWESTEAREARRLFEEGKLKEALSRMPKHLSLERRVLTLLLKGLKPKDVIMKLGRGIIEIFIEALQSYIINLSLSELYLMYGGCEELLKRCEVLPYPIPTLDVRDVCSEVVTGTFKEIVSNAFGPFSKYLRRGFREVVVSAKNIHVSYDKGEVKLCFSLPPSAYATVILREILRDKLKVRVSSYLSEMQ